VSYTLLSHDDLPYDGNTYEFQGIEHQDTHVSFIWVDMNPGGTIRLHKHPYEEIFIIQDGTATFTVGSATLEASAGQVLIIPADIPHKFMNLSGRQLKQIDIHVNKQFVTHWLED
jgi:mannose-6-phosphate isomerase-like protein (cupin superfamily)